ncbi:MAG: hypothetical protein ACM31C_30680 [Acidobacteriota bacterium]
MSPETRTLVHRTSLANAAIAVALSPLPLLDELVLAPVLGVLGARIARRHQLARRDIPWRPMLRATAVGLAARFGLDVAVAIPVASAALSATTAAALTELLGEYYDAACRDPAHVPALHVREIASRIRQRVASRTGQRTAPAGAGIREG